MPGDDATEPTTAAERTAERRESLRSLDEDAAATSFLDLEAELAAEADGVGPAVEDGTYGQVVDATRVDADVVPADYPREIDADTAVALDLSLPDGRERTAFFAWPGDDEDAPLARLLAALEIPLDSFADLYGKRLLLTVDGGYVLPAVPPSTPRGSPAGVYGVVAGLAVNLLALGLAVAGSSLLVWLPFVVLFLLVNLLALPLSTYADGWHLRTRTDWDQGPAFWALLSMLWGVNVVVSAAYLYSRRSAQPLSPS